jgi:diguanylate cyclase (GGDEF)-like protein/PAS domain S-box-containing protein
MSKTRKLTAITPTTGFDSMGSSPKENAAASADRERLHAVAQVGLCYLDTELRFLYVNPWLARINGVSAEGHLGKKLDEIMTPVAQRVAPQLGTLLQSGEPILHCEISVETPAHPAGPRSLEHSFFPDKDAAGNIVGISCVIHDVTEIAAERDGLSERIKQLETANERLVEELVKAKRAYESIEKEAVSVAVAYKELEDASSGVGQLDQLTGLGNRELFLRQLKHLCAIAERRKEEVALLVIDLDGFREFNDWLGQEAGDEVLREFAVRLDKSLRKADQKYRIGGDEFAVLLDPRTGALEGARSVAEHIAGELTAPMEYGGQKFAVGVSIGIAVSPQHGRDPSMLLREAVGAKDIAKSKRQIVVEASEPGSAKPAKELQPEIFQMIFVSTAVRPMSERDLIEILLKGRVRSERLRLTGMLLYKDEQFMHVLEGDEASVRQVFREIESDNRQKSVDVLRSNPIDKRNFPDWTMGFEGFDYISVPAYTRFLEQGFRPDYFDESAVEAHAMLLAFKGVSLKKTPKLSSD